MAKIDSYFPRINYPNKFCYGSRKIDFFLCIFLCLSPTCNQLSIPKTKQMWTCSMLAFISLMPATLFFFVLTIKADRLDISAMEIACEVVKSSFDGWIPMLLLVQLYAFLHQLILSTCCRGFFVRQMLASLPLAVYNYFRILMGQ